MSSSAEKPIFHWIDSTFESNFSSFIIDVVVDIAIVDLEALEKKKEEV